MAKLKKKHQENVQKRLKRNPHRSFRRTYREDYVRDLKVPGILAHLIKTVLILAKNWKIFVPLVVLAVVLNVVFVGIMSESTYTQFQDTLDETASEMTGEQLGNVAKAGMLLTTTIVSGGLSGEMNESSVLWLILILVMVWLVTIYILRQRMAGHRVKLRDGLYNAMAPVVPTVVLLTVALVECVPVMLTIIVYSAAVTTEFLAMPFYALLFFIFAALMILLSGYLLAGALMALVAVSAPGLYPWRALSAATDLMVGRRTRFLIRLVAMALAVIIVWTLVLLPVVLIDLAMKQNWAWTEGAPLVPVALNVMLCITVVYVTAYLYLYYRWMLDGEEAEAEVEEVIGAGKKVKGEKGAGGAKGVKSGKGARGAKDGKIGKSAKSVKGKRKNEKK